MTDYKGIKRGEAQGGVSIQLYCNIRVQFQYDNQMSVWFRFPISLFTVFCRELIFLSPFNIKDIECVFVVLYSNKNCYIVYVDLTA